MLIQKDTVMSTIDNRWLSIAEVIRITTLSKAVIMKMIKSESFPKSRTEDGHVVWDRDELTAWMHDLPVVKGDVAKPMRPPAKAGGVSERMRN
jgi:predicted DNA-binding transcriptional regulator AlpA